MIKLITWPYLSAAYLASQDLSETFPERFWSKVQIMPSGCWEYQGAISHGYGAVTRGARGAGNIIASRASWILCCGPIPEGFQVQHNCPVKHNRKCVNPAHLKLGKDPENGDDSVRQGTNYFARNKGKYVGENHGNAKFPDAVVAYILKNYTGKRGEQARFARELNVSRSCIWGIIHGASRVTRITP